MNLPDDCRLTYIVAHEAWYHESAHRVIPLTGGDTGRSLSVHAASNGGGVAWEFSVNQYEFGQGNSQPAVKLAMFGDAFAAFLDIPEFFAALTEQRPNDLHAVRVILDELGAEDTTARETLERYRGMERAALAQKLAEAKAALDAYDATHGANA